MTPNLFGSDGQQIRLSKQIGKGGEGEVYAVEGNGAIAVKYYTGPDAYTRENKIRFMVAQQLSVKSPLVAFPIALVFDRVRKFAGFTMPRIAGHQPLHELYSPRARKAAFPQADYRFLVLCAANITRAVGMTHSSGCVVGDINHSGILVSSKATVTLIDADSFQVSDGTKFYPCKVGVPEYTPPELQGKPLGSVVRTPNHDAFGLAVVIFQLLFMGRHPYSGRYASGEMPLDRAIGEHRFAYSKKRAVGMVPPPGVPTLNDFPPAIGDAFEAAFAPGTQPTRPTAKQWMALLDELRQTLRVCATSPLHLYPTAATECPWCRMEMRFAVPLFLPVLPAFDPNATFVPTPGDVLQIWRAIEAVPAPSSGAFPQYTGSMPVPSAKIAELSQTRTAKKLGGWAVLAGAAILALNVPQALLVALIIAGVGWWLLASKSSSDEEAIKNFRGAQTSLYEAEAEWSKQNSAPEFVELRSALKKKKDSYDALQQEEKNRLEEYARNRKSEQLKTFLDSYQIRRFKIPKVGPGRQATLLSYGIETAADISEGALFRVPGFGPKTSQPLLNWRRHLESRFVYNAARTPADAAAANAIKVDIARRAAELKLELSTGPAKLSQLSAAIAARQTANFPYLQALLKQRAQTVADLEALGIKLPDVPRPPPPQTRNPSPFTQTTASPAPWPPVGTSGQSVRCPKCSSNMVIRTAMRGPTRGNKFYGCPRYPACNGTRPFP